VFTPRRIRLWGTGLLVLSWFVYVYTIAVPGLVDRIGRFKGTDYIQFYVMGSLMLDGRSDALYDADAHLQEGRRRIDPGLTLYAAHPNYPPQVALAFTPLAHLPYGWSLAVFLALMACCYGASVWMIWRRCPGLQRHGALVGVLAAASPLFFALLRYGQASAVALLIWCLVLAALGRNRSFLAGLAIGCLAYKPQLGMVFAVVMIAAREWRVIAGAVTALAAQLAIAWWATDAPTMGRYAGQLWTLMRDPTLVQIYPSEVHSLRGFFQLLLPSHPAVTVCYLAALAVALYLAARCWFTAAPAGLRVAQLVVLTVLSSPHLLTYDLVLLTLPLLVFADWIVRHPDHAAGPAVRLLSVLMYFAPFSANLARLVPIQLSVLVLAATAWYWDQIISEESRHSCVPATEWGSIQRRYIHTLAMNRNSEAITSTK